MSESARSYDSVVEVQNGAIDPHGDRAMSKTNGSVVFGGRRVWLPKFDEYFRPSGMEVRLTRVQFKTDPRTRKCVSPLLLTGVRDGLGKINFRIGRAASDSSRIVIYRLAMTVQLLQDIPAFYQIFGVKRIH